MKPQDIHAVPTIDSLRKVCALLRLFAGIATFIYTTSAQASEVTANPSLNGEQAFAACASCHSLQENAAHKVGPNLWGVYGRAAAQADGYAYSPALAAAGLIWTRETLFAWIAGSEALVPSSWMLYHNDLRAEEVMALIDHLASHSNRH